MAAEVPACSNRAHPAKPVELPGMSKRKKLPTMRHGDVAVVNIDGKRVCLAGAIISWAWTLRVLVFFGAGCKQLYRAAKILSNEAEDYSGPFLGQTWEWEGDSENRCNFDTVQYHYGVLLPFRRPRSYRDIDTITHECHHVVDFACEERGVPRTRDNTEPLAYLAGGLVGEVGRLFYRKPTATIDLHED